MIKQNTIKFDMELKPRNTELKITTLHSLLTIYLAHDIDTSKIRRNLLTMQLNLHAT